MQLRASIVLICVCVFQLIVPVTNACASEGEPTAASTSQPRPQKLGLQGVGMVGLSWQGSSDSFDTLGLPTSPTEFGGGAQVINIWHSLFVQVGYSQWKETGERIFIDSRGTTFGLGIPLTVKTNSLDVGAGWRFERAFPSGNLARIVPFVGGGMGVAQYTESSPFAQSEDDLDTSKPSYHLFGGAEAGITRWLGVAGDVRFRSVPGLLGEGGTSQALTQTGFSGTSVSVRVLIGPRSWPRSAKPPSPSASPVGRTPSTDATVVKPPVTAPPTASSAPVPPAPEPTATAHAPVRATHRAPPPPSVSPLVAGWVHIRTNAPVYIYPDPKRAALSVLRPGTRVLVREEQGDWLLIEFQDVRLGTRTGYVLRANCER